MIGANGTEGSKAPSRSGVHRLTDPGDGKEKIVELKCINMGPSRYDSREATSLRAAVNKREQQLYQEYLTKLRLKDRRLLSPDGEIGPLERGFRSATSPEDFKPWALGFYNEQSDELAKLPVMLADAQIARWQSKYIYGRDPTDQQRSCLGKKIRTDIAMIGTKLNAQVTIKNLRPEHAHEVTPTHGPGSAREIGASLGISGLGSLGPPARQGTA
jgi:hypothetical protein